MKICLYSILNECFLLFHSMYHCTYYIDLSCVSFTLFTLFKYFFLSFLFDHWFRKRVSICDKIPEAGCVRAEDLVGLFATDSCNIIFLHKLSYLYTKCSFCACAHCGYIDWYWRIYTSTRKEYKNIIIE